MAREFKRVFRKAASAIGRIVLIVALGLMASATVLDLLQLQASAGHFYFCSARWMGTGLALGVLACAGFWLSPRYDPVAGTEGKGHPTLDTLLVIAFYAASWMVRKQNDRHLTVLAITLSTMGLLALLSLTWRALHARFQPASP